MKRILTILFCTWGLFSISKVNATHIVGAELYYECADSANSVYDVTLKLYRDCENGQAPFDAMISLFVFDAATGNTWQTTTVPAPANTPEIQPEDWDDCIAIPPAICVEEGIYSTQLTLPPNTGGYYLGWSRCCRNANITNLANPLSEGITFLARVPGSAEAACNSMPTFDAVPPVFLCANEPFTFDHSATDVDGDSLVYAITDPYTGTNTAGLGTGNPMMGGNDPVVDPFNNPMGPPPYNTVQFGTGFSFFDPFGSGNFTIDPLTGLINVTPNQAGIFVFSISVFEYRNGILLTENRRDFQIHVLQCKDQGPPPEIVHDLTGLNFSNDTVFVNAGVPFCYGVTISDSVATDTVAAYTVSAAFGNGPFIPPWATFNFSGVNPITGQVCWTPACAYDGQIIPLIIGAYDIGDCENVANVFDTVWINISVPPNQPPVITPDYSGLMMVGDTIIINANDSLCYTFDLTDPNQSDILNAFTVSPIFSSGTNPPTFSTTGTNPVQGEICWTPDCAQEGQLYELTIGGTDMGLCVTPLSASSTVYIKVIDPPNLPPTISTNLTGTNFSNDTIFVNALDNFCFDFTGLDPDIGDGLTPVTGSPIFGTSNGPTITSTGTNPLNGQICWTPACQYEDQVIPLIFGVQDPGSCLGIGEAFDTVYIAVSVPPNSPPIITTNLGSTNHSNDTIFIDANDNFCFDFLVLDPDPGTTLSTTAVSPIFTDPDGPTFSVNGTNPVMGQVCWTPNCSFVGQTIELIYTATDNGSCSSQLSASDTVYVVIQLPPNDPPTIVHDLTGLNFSGDTIFANATEALCFDLLFSDPNSADTLTPFAVSPIFTGTNPATFTFSGVNPLQGQVCWTPDCADEGALIEIIMRVEDNGDCQNILEAFDTVYIKISDPLTVAPIVGHDLSGNPDVGGDTIYIFIGDSLCYNFFIADQTTDNGINYNYEFQNLGGTNIGLANINVNFTNDSIVGSVCFKSDCSNGGSLYRSIVTGIDKETCPPFKQASDTVYIRVITDFLSFAGTDTSFCEGTGGVQLNVVPIGGASPYYYTWGCSDPGNCGFSNPYISNPSVNPTDTTTYFVQIADKNGCTSEFDNVIVNVKKLPIVDAGPDRFMCEGGFGVGLNCTILNPLEAPAPYTYNWIPPAGLSNPGIVNPHATPDSTTIYTVIVGSANGCTSDNTNLDTLSTVAVNVKPRPEVEAGPDREICFGDTTQLFGHATEAGPDYSYIWTPATGLADSSNQAPMASPPRTTTYFLIANSNGCPSVADSVTIRVRNLPTADPGTSYEICGGDTLELNGIAGGDSTATYTYQWSPAAGLDNPTSATPNASPQAPTTYTLVATSNYGCESDQYQVFMNVLPGPIVNAGPDGFICKGDSFQLNGSHTMIGGAAQGPIFYSWTPVNGLNGFYIPDPIASPNQSTVYTLTVSTGACSHTDEAKVDVFDAVTIDVTADTMLICEGDSVGLFAKGGLGSPEYTWFPSTGLSDSSIANPMAAPSQTTTYYARVAEGACKAEQGITIEVNPLPRLDYYTSVDNGCAELTVSFIENTQYGTNFIWDFGDGSPISNEASPTHTYSEEGEYQVSLTAQGTGGCFIEGSLGVILVRGKAMAQFSALPDTGEKVPLPHAEVQFTDLSDNAVSWFWDFGDGNVSRFENPLHTYTEAGEYTVSLTVTDESGCVDSYELDPIIVFNPEIFIPNVFSPNQDGINDLFQIRYDGSLFFSLDIFDRWGRPIYNNVGVAGRTWDGITSAGSPASEGVYYYVVKIGERSFTGNVTLMR